MDFFRAGAIPALIALASSALPAVAADCQIDGTYQYRSEGPKEESETFNRLVHFKQGEGQKLFRYDTPPGVAQGWDSAQLRSRPKYTVLATQAEVSGSRVRFLDASRNLLVEGTLDAGDKWSCKAGRLERSSERMTGVGEDIRTDRLEESLRRDGDALVYAETRTTIDPPGGKPRSRQVRFRAAR